MTRADAADLIKRGLACGVITWEQGSLVARANRATSREKFITSFGSDEVKAVNSLALANTHAPRMLLLAREIAQRENGEQRKARYETIGKLLSVDLPTYGTTNAKQVQRLAKMVDDSQRRADLWREANHLQTQTANSAGGGN